MSEKDLKKEWEKLENADIGTILKEIIKLKFTIIKRGIR